MICSLLVLLSFSFFSQSDNKEKKTLHNDAETAFSRSDYMAAKKSYGELCKKIEKPEQDWQNYVDIIVRYAEVHLLLKEYAMGETLLLDLLEKNPPAEFHPRIVVLLGRIYSFQEKAGHGYIKMLEASKKCAIEKWRPEERSFFHAVEYALNAYYENLIQKAKHFSAAGSYKEALEAYKCIAQGIEFSHFPNALKNTLLKKKILFRLAESHFLNANYENTLQLTQPISPPQDHIDAEMLFLAALCYKEKREYEKSLLCLQNYLSSEDANLLFHYDCALFEAGQFYFRNGNHNKAKEYLEKLLSRTHSLTRPVLVGTVCLGKIYCSEKLFNEAERLFSFIQEHLAKDDPLLFEVAFYQGEIAFERKMYGQAALFFEKALSPATAKGDWTKNALYKLALCYSRQPDSELLRKGEDILEKFLKHQFDEHIVLTLADIYSSEKNISKFERLKAQAETLLSEIGKKEIMLLEADLKEGYSEKTILLEKVITSSIELPPELMAKALCSQAMNEITLGLESRDKKDLYFRRAISFLERAFPLIEKCDEKVSSQFLRLETQAHCLLKDQKLALSFVDKLDQDLGNREKLYLKALLLSHMDQLEYKMMAAKIFEQIVTLYPESEFADDALYALATLSFKNGHYLSAKKYFVHLAEQYHLSPYADLGYYWAAEASEKGGEDCVKSQYLRKECYEKFPCSPKASDAYFQYYKIHDYVQGRPEALAHIQSFPSLFPHSSLLPVVYFLIGYHEISYPIAKVHLEKALELFNQSQNEESSFMLFRYRTMLELAKLDMRYNTDVNPALKMLLTLVSELREMPESLKEKSSYPPIYEESEFVLFHIYSTLKKETLAYEVLLSMLKHYSEAGIREGYYLSEVWKEQGLLALAAKDYGTGLSCFEVSLEAGLKYLNEEERFSLLILESDCYRSLLQYDNAMKVLSTVINENADSHLRLKAMFLRSEIYELQGRNELSIRQLISLAKLEGKWALDAKEKLRKVYGIDQ